jgi:CRISPR-associated protein Cmr1
MSPFFRLIAELDVLTPLFLGGASQEAELRTPSVKGAMRFWYRALDPAYQTREGELFGSGGKDARQSLLLLRCRPGHRALERLHWRRDVRVERFNQGTGRQTTNGLTYLAYPLELKGNDDRTAIVPGARFTVEVTCRRAPKHVAPELPLRAALASLWSLGHFGALGMRARRGFGALALTGWRLEDANGQSLAADEIEELQLLCQATSPSQWAESARRALDVLKRWFGAFEGGDEQEARPRGKGGRPDRSARVRHLHFGPRADFVVGSEQVKRDDWQRAMLSLGSALQAFRQRKQPDYQAVKDHVLSNLERRGNWIQRTPERATFGLPLTFRYGSVPRGRPVTFAPVDGERHGSPLFLRPVLVGDRIASLFLRLDGDVPGIDTFVGVRGTGRSLEPAGRDAVDDFMQEMKRKAAQ